MGEKLDEASFFSEQERLPPEFRQVRRIDGKDSVTLFDLSGDHRLVGVTFKVRPEYFHPRTVHEGTAPYAHKYLAHKFKHEPRKLRGYHLSVTHSVVADAEMAPGDYLGDAGGLRLFQQKLPEEMALKCFVDAHRSDMPYALGNFLQKMYISPNLLLEAGKMKRDAGVPITRPDGVDANYYVQSGVQQAADDVQKPMPSTWHETLVADSVGPSNEKAR